MTPVWMYLTKEKGISRITGAGIYGPIKVGKKVRLCLSIITPFVPTISDGKTPDLGEMNHAIVRAVEKAFKRANRIALARGPVVKTDQKSVILANLDAAIAKTSGEGKYRFSLRQLFYAIRPYVIRLCGVELKYDTFAQKVITPYESDRGMYRDSRGTIYHPHTGEEISLGTLNVEAYRRPGWTFKNVLFSEKEGLFQILRDHKWPEINDCALATSKGFATRAIRDLVDDLCKTGEPVKVFCIHDADAGGTLIYQTLQDATPARPGRTVPVINLGLDPWEALKMGLEPESVQPSKDEQKKPVGRHVRDYDKSQRGNPDPLLESYGVDTWEQWLQCHRVELNVMSSPEFLGWIDRKFAPYRDGKLVPPTEVLHARLIAEARERVRKGKMEQILAEARLEDQVESIMAGLGPVLDDRADDLSGEVGAKLEREPAEYRLNPVRSAAEEIVRLKLDPASALTSGPTGDDGPDRDGDGLQVVGHPLAQNEGF